MKLPLATQVLRRCVTGGVTALSLASLRWHYPDQVRRVFLTRASQRCTGPLAFATLRQRADYTPRLSTPTIAESADSAECHILETEAELAPFRQIPALALAAISRRHGNRLRP